MVATGILCDHVWVEEIDNDARNLKRKLTVISQAVEDLGFEQLCSNSLHISCVG